MGLLNDNMDMETSKQSMGPEKPKEELTEVEPPIQKQAGSARSPDAKDESPDEEPGTFDRVYEHGRQMGF